MGDTEASALVAGGPPRAETAGDTRDDPWLSGDLEASASSTWVLQEVAEQTSYGEIFLNDLLRRQRRLSLSVAGVFLALLFGLPLVNLLFPAVSVLHVLGLPISWLLLAVLMYPLLWLLAWYFTATARALEDDFVELIGRS